MSTNVHNAATVQVPRRPAGFLVEYFAGTTRSALGQYLGHVYAEQPPDGQALGSEGRQVVMLVTDIEVNRSFSKRRVLKAGTTLTRMVSPLEGREVR